ncbi:hypothetical protein H632_c1263p0 [Helicosporidium sp. ATCC 50920]|nr:hypothetical protein H632_c1263p0 [Helicosporidium sp. ATCC 50920]|eukprot:KDD74513.1 hypothetical protein H632_c1263p0 [Helicosporidium sp. ATCC 50920]
MFGGKSSILWGAVKDQWSDLKTDLAPKLATLKESINSAAGSWLPRGSSEEFVLRGRRLRVLRTLGEGGYAIVYLVELAGEGGPQAPRAPAQRFALKKMFLATPEQERAARMEVDVMRRVRSPHILPLLAAEVVTLPGQAGPGSGQRAALLLFPLVEGGTLFDRVWVDPGGREAPPASQSGFGEAREAAAQSNTAGDDWAAGGWVSAPPSNPRQDPFPGSQSRPDGSHRGKSILDGFGEPEAPRTSCRSLPAPQTLSQRSKGPLPLEVAVQTFAEVCGALESMHALNPPLAHWDVKPHNVLLRPRTQRCPVEGWDEESVLIDFGSARPARIRADSRHEAGALQEEAEALCTGSYRAPELWEVEAGTAVTEMVDVWSAGCLLFFCLTGDSPFEARAGPGGSLRLAVLNGVVDWPRDELSGAPRIPPGVQELVQACLQLDPGARPSAREAREWAEALLAGEESRSRPLSSARSAGASAISPGRASLEPASPPAAPAAAQEIDLIGDLI